MLVFYLTDPYDNLVFGVLERSVMDAWARLFQQIKPHIAEGLTLEDTIRELEELGYTVRQMQYVEHPNGSKVFREVNSLVAMAQAIKENTDA